VPVACIVYASHPKEDFTCDCNDEGALRRPTADEDDIMVPGEVVVAGKVVQVSAGDCHTAALTDEGHVGVWGIFWDGRGKLRLIKEKKMCKTPTLIMDDLTVLKIVSSTDHLVALTDRHQVYTMGCAEKGQLGRVLERFSQASVNKLDDWSSSTVRN
jgi:regulator of chromosome condensation